MNGTSFTGNNTFIDLAAGTYNLTVKDASNCTASTTVTLSEPESYEVIPAEDEPILGFAQTDPNVRTTLGDDDGFIIVRQNKDSKPTKFKLSVDDYSPKPYKGGKLTINSGEYAGTYTPYFYACNPDIFIGLYKENCLNETSGTCTPTKSEQHPNAIITKNRKALCKECWLSEDAFSEKVKDIMVFSNGYRGPQNEGEESNDLIQNYDHNSYWEGQDVAFKARRKSDITFYVDGHCSIVTSDHNLDSNADHSFSTKASSIKNFANSLASSIDATVEFLYVTNGQQIKNPCYHNPSCVHLNDKPNPIGFNYRYQKGKIAGKNLATKLFLEGLSSPHTKITYHIDIVAHSMGFAYAQGMIEYLKNESDIKNNLKWGGYYIIAPENGCGSVVVKSQCETNSIYQYGSDYKR
jgi:hypothetical protein